MKKLLFIIILFSAVLSYGQKKKISQMTPATVVNGSDVFPIVQSGANFKATKTIMQQELSDSVTLLRSDLENILDRIDVLEDSANVINTTPTNAVLIFNYTFEGVTTDVLGNHDLTSSLDSFYYSDVIENENFVANFTNDVSLTSGSINLTNTFTFSGEIWSDVAQEERKTLVTNKGATDTTGFEVAFDAVNGQMEFITWADDDDSLVATSNTGIYFPSNPPGVPFKYDILVNKTNGLVAIYINGSDETLVGVCETTFNVSDTLRYGIGFDGRFPFFSKVDNIKGYTGLLTATDISNNWELSDIISYENDGTDPTVIGQWCYIDSVVVVQFSEPMQYAVADSVISGFTYTADASPIIIDSIQADTSFTYLNLYTDPVDFDEVLLLSWAEPDSGGLTDRYQNVLLDTSDLPIDNRLLGAVTVSTAEYHYLFENNPLDASTRGRTGTYDGGYSTSSPLQGSFSMLGTSAEEFVMPFFDHDTVFTLFCRHNYNDVSTNSMMGERGVIGGDDTGWRWRVDMDNGGVDFMKRIADVNYEVRTANGVVEEGVDYSFAVVIKDDKTRFYVDGVFSAAAGDDSITISGEFTTTDSINIGDSNTYGLMDDWQFYNRAVPADSILWLHNNPGESLTGIGGAGADPGDPPPADTSDISSYATVVLSNTWESTNTGLITKTELSTAYGGATIRFVNGFGESGTWPGQEWKDTTCVVVVLDANNVMKAHYHDHSVGLYRPEPTHFYGSGFQFEPEIESGHTELYVTTLVKIVDAAGYSIYQSRGQLTGKFPGGVSGGNPAASGTGDDWDGHDGFKCDFAFGGAAGQWTTTLRGYLYHVNQQYEFGDIKYLLDPVNGGYYRFDSDWHSYTMRIVLNTVGLSNGFVEMFIDGRFSVIWEGLELRQSPGVYLDHIKNYWFWGGSNIITMNSLRNEFLYHDEQYVFKYNDDENVPRGFTKSQQGRVLELPNWDVETDSPVFH